MSIIWRLERPIPARLLPAALTHYLYGGLRLQGATDAQIEQAVEDALRPEEDPALLFGSVVGLEKAARQHGSQGHGDHT